MDRPTDPDRDRSFIVTVRTMVAIDARQDSHQTPDPIVSGHQWWRLKSTDVIHDFWATDLARKIDGAPGRPSFIWLEADHAGFVPKKPMTP